MCMYLWVELKLDKVARLCLDIVGVKSERTIGSADLDDVCINHSCWCHRSSCRRTAC